MINNKEAQEVIDALNVKHVSLHEETTASIHRHHALALRVVGLFGAELLGLLLTCVRVFVARFFALSQVVPALECCVFCSDPIGRQIDFIILNLLLLRPATAFSIKFGLLILF